jgi:hypothetical protein
VHAVRRLLAHSRCYTIAALCTVDRVPVVRGAVLAAHAAAAPLAVRKELCAYLIGRALTTGLLPASIWACPEAGLVDLTTLNDIVRQHALSYFQVLL